jgi:putative acetyltransferase
LRDAVAADRPALLDLWVAAWQAAMPEIDFEVRRSWIETHLDDLSAAGARILVACVEGVPAGFVTVDPARGHLDQLAVHPVHQGGGTADLLMRGAKTLSPRSLRLDVNADNGRARRFYARHGFEAVATGTNPRSGLPTISLLWRNSQE